MDKEQVARKYLEWINKNYDSQKKKLQSFCNDKNYDWDEDIFCDTYLKVYEKILKNGMLDSSDNGFDNYTFLAFKINTMRNKQYARVQKRDNNIINLSGVYEQYTNTLLTEREKLQSDLRKDFFTLYLLSVAEEHFDYEHFYLFRLKTFDKTMTYQKLQEKTGLKGVRQKVVDVKNYLKNNVSKAEVEKAFEETYGELF